MSCIIHRTYPFTLLLWLHVAAGSARCRDGRAGQASGHAVAAHPGAAAAASGTAGAMGSCFVAEGCGAGDVLLPMTTLKVLQLGLYAKRYGLCDATTAFRSLTAKLRN